MKLQNIKCKTRVVRLGWISASAFIEKGEICVTVGQLKQVVPCVPSGHYIFPFFFLFFRKSMRLRYMLLMYE